MAQVNKKSAYDEKTHEGAQAHPMNPVQALERSVMSCLLWESEFYEEGESIAERINKLVSGVKTEDAVRIALKARNDMKLRHAPLWIALAMATHRQHRSAVGHVLAEVIQRPDEITEFLSLYWKDKKEPLAAQVKKGLSRAFNKFSEYQFAKWNRDKEIRLKDALFLCHAKPDSPEKAELFKKLIDNTLQTPDTWEVALSAGKDKKDTFTRMLTEKTLPDMAFIMNLRNMKESGIDKSLVREKMSERSFSRILPFRFIAAAKAVPGWEDILEKPMLTALNNENKIPGHSLFLIDVSGSMDAKLSDKSELSRLDAACALAILLREISEDVSVFTFSDKIAEIPARQGFALADVIKTSQPHSGTYLGKAVDDVSKRTADRLIVITDEQSHDTVKQPKSKGYMINVASFKNGVGYGKWTHVDGWSESVVRFIQEMESSDRF